MNGNPARTGRKVTVRVFHNIARDERGRYVGYDGYQHGHPVVEVFQTSADSTDDPATICESVAMLLALGCRALSWIIVSVLLSALRAASANRRS